MVPGRTRSHKLAVAVVPSPLYFILLWYSSDVGLRFIPLLPKPHLCVVCSRCSQMDHRPILPHPWNCPVFVYPLLVLVPYSSLVTMNPIGQTSSLVHFLRYLPKWAWLGPRNNARVDSMILRSFSEMIADWSQFPSWNSIALEKKPTPLLCEDRSVPIPPSHVLWVTCTICQAPPFLSLPIETHSSMEVRFPLAFNFIWLLRILNACLGLGFIAITICELQRIWNSLFSILSLFCYCSQPTCAVWYLCQVGTSNRLSFLAGGCCRFCNFKRKNFFGDIPSSATGMHF